MFSLPFLLLFSILSLFFLTDLLLVSSYMYSLFHCFPLPSSLFSASSKANGSGYYKPVPTVQKVEEPLAEEL